MTGAGAGTTRITSLLDETRCRLIEVKVQGTDLEEEVPQGSLRIVAMHEWLIWVGEARK
jgi:hypothetical protein